MQHLCKVSAMCLTAASLVLAQIQPVVSGDDGKGEVDWSERYIVATGIGAPNPNLPESAQRPGAERAAKIVALRNALETVKGMYLNSSTTIENFMTKNDVVSTSVSGFIQGFEKEGRTKYMSDGTVEITMKIPLDGVGGLGAKVYGDNIGDKPSVSQWDGKGAKKKMVFTGLIIDCKGLNVKPALSPKVLDESGKEIYGSAYVSREWAVKYGIVGYAKNVLKASKLGRVGDSPGKVTAVKASGANSTDVVLSNKDAAEVRSAAENLKFLSECRVIFVVD
ncbi:MAG: hypothetical protein GF398_14525 [Chitinivibrionales bacterium]|nr:hypothetical protein [Chitinivibrionales bacterium]